jgi:urease accessory protein
MSVLNAPELALYHDEPKQMPSGAPGKHGVLDMAFACRGDRSVLAHLYREAPLLVQQALYWDEHLPGLPCVYIITTSGCVLQGDRLDISVTVGPGAMAHVTTQAATKIHQMDANFAAVSQQLTLADNSYLELLPGPVIPHRHSRFITHTRATVAESATLLGAELLQPGRKHHGAGELFEFDLYSSTLTASRPDATPLFTEKLIAEPRRHAVRQAGVMGNFDIFANVTLITPRQHADRIFERVVPGADASADCVAGASRLPNGAGLVYKVLGTETEPVKAKVRAFWDLVRQQVLGSPIPAARPWGSPLLPDAAGTAEICRTEGAATPPILRTTRTWTRPTRWTALAEEEPDITVNIDDVWDIGPDEKATDDDVRRYLSDDGPDSRAGRLVDKDGGGSMRELAAGRRRKRRQSTSRTTTPI